jgi:hypothetical protein
MLKNEVGLGWVAQGRGDIPTLFGEIKRGSSSDTAGGSGYQNCLTHWPPLLVFALYYAS